MRLRETLPERVLLLLVTGVIAVPLSDRASAVAEPAASAAPPAERRAFLGELHLHTSYSFDAFGFSPSRIDPDAAYRFARGETVTYLGKPAQCHTPLDFMAVTDHAKYMGFLNATEDPGRTLAQFALGLDYLGWIARLRVLEVETPRWTTLMADRLGLDRPMGTAAMLRERAWSSPIWYQAP